MLVTGIILLTIFIVVVVITRKSPPRPHEWIGPGGTRKPWLGPGGIRPLYGDANMGFYPYEGFANPSATDSPTFFMIGMEGCKYCIAAKPDFLSIGPTATIAGKTVSFQYLDQAADKSRLPACEIKGFPTFCLVHNGKTVKYEGERNPDAYKAFVEKNLAA